MGRAARKNAPTEVDRTTGAGVILHPVTFFVALASRIAPPTNSAMEPPKSDQQDLNSVTWSGNAPILMDSQSQLCQHQILVESQNSENSEKFRIWKRTADFHQQLRTFVISSEEERATT